MAEQFSLPQEQVLKELNGEGLGWVLPWGPSHPLIHALEEVGIRPIPAAWHSLHCRAPRPKRRRREGGEARPPCRLSCALQALAAASGRRSTPSSRAPCMRRWPQYSAWARVSVSGGPAPPSPSPTFLLPPQGPHSCLSALSVHSWLHVPWGHFHYNYREQGPAGPLGWGRERCSDSPQGL